MKVYINNNTLNIYNLKHLNKIEDYFIKKDYIIKIYSELGIFKFNKNRFYKLLPFDKNIESIIINDTEFLIDNSFYKLGKQQYQIPVNHYVEKLSMNIYRLRKNALIELVLVKLPNGDVIDLYFSTKENLFNVKEDLDTFLSLLK